MIKLYFLYTPLHASFTPLRLCFTTVAFFWTGLGHKRKCTSERRLHCANDLNFLVLFRTPSVKMVKIALYNYRCGRTAALPHRAAATISWHVNAKLR
jgi:hypothetical protein